MAVTVVGLVLLAACGSGAPSSTASPGGTPDPTAAAPGSDPGSGTLGAAPLGSADTGAPGGSGPAGTTPATPAAPGGTGPAGTTAAPAGAGTAPSPAAALGARPLPTSPDALAAELTEVERQLGAAGLTQAAARPWGQRQQVLYRALSSHPDWAEGVLAATGADVRPVVALNWQARAELSALGASSAPAPTLPAWDIAPPRPADELIGYYRESARLNGLPWEVLAAINLIESRMGRIHGVSSAGAVGPMQFLPSTWAACCTGDPADDHDAIVGAGRYLVRRGAPDRMDRAIFSYNRSNHYVAAVKAYAQVLTLDPNRYYGYHAWDVVYPATVGLVRLPEGYRQAAPVDAATWVRDHPADLLAPA